MLTGLAPFNEIVGALNAHYPKTVRLLKIWSLVGFFFLLFCMYQPNSNLNVFYLCR